MIGNLLWAASCFVPGVGVIASVGELAQAGMTNLGEKMYAAMIVGGAVGASGVAQRWAADPSGDPTGKDVIAAVLNTKRTELGTKLEGNVEMLALELVRVGYDFDRIQSRQQSVLGRLKRYYGRIHSLQFRTMI